MSITRIQAIAIMGSLYFLNPDDGCGETGSFEGAPMVNIPAEMREYRGAGILVVISVKQLVAQVPAGGIHSFRRMIGQVLLSFHTWGKKAYYQHFVYHKP